MIPNALQIGWLTAGLRRTDQQIATELKIERRELRIKTGGELAHPHVGRLIGLSVRSQIERYPFDPRTVSRDVVGFQPGIALFPRTATVRYRTIPGIVSCPSVRPSISRRLSPEAVTR